jgi:acyl-CoA thioester hydrolase
MRQYTTQMPVLDGHIDALGHVNNAVYQQYLEQAAVEHSAALGYSFERYRDLGGVFVMRRITIDYRRPALPGDVLVVTTRLGEMGGVRATRHYEIRRASDDELLLTAESLWAWVDWATMRPRAIPRSVLHDFGNAPV